MSNAKCNDTKFLPEQNKKNDCPYVHQNNFRRTLVWWMNPILSKGYKEKLKVSDLYTIADKHSAETLTSNLEKRWNAELERAKRKNIKPSFKRAFVLTYLNYFMLSGFLALAWEVLRCLGPILIGEISKYYSNPNEYPLNYALLCAGGIAFSAISSVWISQMFSLRLQVLGWNSRTAIVGLMYKKTLKLSNEALLKTTSGHIVNLSATDPLRLDYGFYFLHHLWIAPLECGVVTYILWRSLGPSAIVGMSVLFCILIIQAFFGKLFGKLRFKAALATDERVRLMSEIISGMRIIKMYSWEEAFREIVTKLRKKEMRKILHASLLRSFNYTMTHSTTQVLSFSTFMTFSALQRVLDLPTVLVALGLFTVMRVGVGVFFPMAIEKLSEAIIALNRTESFLLLPEVSTSSQSEDKQDPCVTLTDFTGSWTKTGKPILQNISLDVTRGKLIIVVGPVGAGKSSLLSAVLKEISTISGDVKVHGKVAYSSQIPWLFSDTVRSNILFGQEFEPQRYNEVVRACALERDFQILPEGDKTFVGEKGVTLSGGQKARVGLARLAYNSMTDIVLMDDPLSAVDPGVSNHLFNLCICGYLKDKIRILVTHQSQFLEKADQIVILKEGEIVESGTFDDLQSKGIDFSSLLELNKDKEEADVFSVKTIESKFSSEASARISKKITAQFSNSYDSLDLDDHEKNVIGPESVLLQKHDTRVKDEDEKAEKSLLSDRSETPDKSWIRSSYDYFHDGVHFIYIAVLVIFMVLNHSLLLFSDWWLANWARKSEEFYGGEGVADNSSVNRNNSRYLSTSTTESSTSSIQTSFEQNWYTMWYSVIFVGFFISMLIRVTMHFYLCVRSSIALHNKMLASILKTKIRFFDTNPVGNILNRFSKDMSQVDEMLPLVFIDVLFLFGSMLFIILFVVAINYFVLIIVFPLILYFIWIRRFYVRTSIEIKRIEGANRSPVFGHLSSTIDGLVMIRTYKVEEDFIRKNNHLQDMHSVAWSAFVFGSRWLAIRLDLLSAIFISSVAFLSLIVVSFLPEGGAINSGNLGLTVTYSITLLSVFQWSVRQSAEAENLMTSTERIREYHHLPAESSDDDKEKPPSDWPSNGAILLKNVSLAYSSTTPHVLQNVTLDIKPKEKIGVVGRTGAGKSSLIAALFRMSDEISGSILIDGIDTSKISLRDLRSVMAIIPQDPVLFGDTMRKNLDVYSTHTDDELWSALQQVQLKPVIEQLPMKLESIVAESGANFSVGQRQLVCLARAILRQNRILVIDEATANVDHRTDHLIQETIRDKFSHCTVLTVAHRLNTIIQSDRIAVLDNGCLIECNHPHLLLQNKKSLFSEMVRMTGEHEKELRKSAEKSYNKKLSEKYELPT